MVPSYALFNVCPGCGGYSVDKRVEPTSRMLAVAVCPACGHRHPFRRLPLFIVTGASGTGKTTVGLRLGAALSECVVLDSDILWSTPFAELEGTDADPYPYRTCARCAQEGMEDLGGDGLEAGAVGDRVELGIGGGELEAVQPAQRLQVLHRRTAPEDRATQGRIAAPDQVMAADRIPSEADGQELLGGGEAHGNYGFAGGCCARNASNEVMKGYFARSPGTSAW
jgi:hypothetical protein